MANMPDAQVVEAFHDAQGRALRLLAHVVRSLEPGMDAGDVAAQARSRASHFGFSRWFHQPEVRIQPLAGGRLVCVDLAPADRDAFGDVEVTVAQGVEEPEVVRVARECTRAVCAYASPARTVGELYVYARSWSNNFRMQLQGRAAGHAVLPPSGPFWPLSARLALLARSSQVQFLNPRRLDGLWAVRPVVGSGRSVASFEEVVAVGSDGRRVLGRDDFREAGTLPD